MLSTSSPNCKFSVVIIGRFADLDDSNMFDNSSSACLFGSYVSLSRSRFNSYKDNAYCGCCPQIKESIEKATRYDMVLLIALYAVTLSLYVVLYFE